MRLRLPETERKKFTELYEKYYKLMLHVADGVLHSRAAAEDAAHTACVRILKHFSGVTAVLLCALSATVFAAKPLFFYRLAFRNADWTEIALAVSDATAGAASAQPSPQFCSLDWVPPLFSECSRTPIEAETGVYDLTMRREDKVLSVYQAPCDAFVLFGSTGTVDAVREELEGMTEIPTRKGRLYFGASEDGRLTALLLREGTAIFASGNIDQRSFLKFVQNIDL